MKITILGLGILLLSSCNTTQKETKQTTQQTPEQYSFDLEGHRGARGLEPENTIPAFKKAMDIGVNTIELDLAVTKDSQLIVSHEPYMNYHTCLDSLGNPIEAKDSLKYNVFKMTYKQVQLFDCGIIGNPRFPEQKKQKITKPLFKDVIAFCESYIKKIGSTVAYNIEIKTDPRADHIFHPDVSTFSDLLIQMIDTVIPKNRVTLQSFDFRVLEYLHSTYPQYKLAALVEKGSAAVNLNRLSFKPDIYSPMYTLLNKSEIDTLKSLNINITPWTVNDTIQMVKLLDWGVNGIITDYPNRAISLLKK